LSLWKHKQDWEELGSMDPFWAILNYSNQRFGKWDVNEFFITGEQEIEKIMHHVTQLGYLSRWQLALDFGCGVGRTTKALAKYFQQCHGVDIAENMILKARELNASIPNCNFFVNNEEDLRLFPDNNFDMIYTNIVLQHMPCKSMIESYISEFMRTLKDEGLLIFQLPSYIPLLNRIQPRRRLYLLLKTLGFDGKFLYERLKLFPGMRMNFIPENEVLELISMTGGKVLEVQVDSMAGTSIQSRTYFITK